MAQGASEELEDALNSAKPSQVWSLKDFDIGRPLGKGHFGKVYLARVRSAEDPYILVLKCITKAEIVAEKVEKQVKREIEVMQSLRHPHILRLLGWFHDSSRVFLMLEFAGQGEVYAHLAKAGRFSEARTSRYISQVADGLAYLHAKSIIHRDIKPENLLMGLDGSIKIADFGWSVQSPSEDSQRTIAGTLSYVAPEMILGQPYGKAIDIWALGVLTYEFLCGEEPFAADTSSGPRMVQARICRCDVQWPTHVSEDARAFVMRLLQLVPGDRLPLVQVPLQPFIAKHAAR